MAILPGLPGLEVRVQSVEGAGAVDLREYQDEGEWAYRKFSHLPASRRSSKYVQSTAGSEFRIRIVLKHPFQITSQSVTFKASVDGHGIAQATCTADYYQRGSYFYMELINSRLDRINAHSVASRPLKFNSLKKVDDADSARVKEDIKAMSGVGDIVISIFRTLQRDPIEPPPANFRSFQHSPPEEVAEKALKGKAISHGVSYGEQQVVARNMKETVDVDGSNFPLGIFIFKYRSKEDLRAEMIIPRSPSPQAPNRFLNFGRDANLPAARQARLANLKREIEEIKAEEEESDQPRGHKRTGDPEFFSGRAYKTSKTPSGKVIVDLTDD